MTASPSPKTTSTYFVENPKEWSEFLEAIAQGDLCAAQAIGAKAGLVASESASFFMDNAELARLSLQVKDNVAGW